ncbi:MAG: rhodanese-like domain-containing protein [Rickettsia endosymbiont of Ixodes persulcatus]|nr:rhodanese-like domain-containing protein [Rickettsia endosymbiont of Ixodes persulcatus]MCZ6903737.1 rhodanese-like domain-containing protein [Rickettsia endosymbiont of Ixodes persulcatus]MCZ6909391.1 rhodanese-like domain-containing protein [Rickettsia endosymbiont of Ixodes persulcatus]MCZ6910283.1 rhodanese-like domain-containing protein [Rickettsia endosymbiont of Ixodes persulcatus]MCZ6914464.1 rhodanese-like domain-containing protein [Rickettsia endosymbiont of Ixodes persulcatus]
MKKIAILSAYSFVNIEEPANLIPKLLLIGKRKYVRGTILLSKEGFNGSFSGLYGNVNLVLEELIKLTVTKDVNIKINYSDVHPFQKLKVRLKKEIVAMNVDDLNVDLFKGEYIEPKDWDSFITKQDVIVIDTRNNYEVEVGTFKSAINPYTETFKQFPAWVRQNEKLLKGKKIAMFCTGGIRCEKSTSLLKSIGYDEVYHLKGGILQYLEDTQNKNNLWQGECFVFDDRRAVADDLSPAKGYTRLPST